MRQFPTLTNDLKECAIVRTFELSQKLIMDGYSRGFFPWYEEEGCFYWFAYNPRFVIFPQKIKVSKSMRQLIHKNKYRITFNTAFEKVMMKCALTERGDDNHTWINQSFLDMYCDLHSKGICKSVEVWNGDELVGGLYGTVINNVFCGESMFHTEPNTSKLALIWLCQNKNFTLIDCQVETQHLISMGAEMIDLETYLAFVG